MEIPIIVGIPETNSYILWWANHSEDHFQDLAMMKRSLEPIVMFVASPRDADEERRRLDKVVKRINNSLGEHLGAIFVTKDWSIVVPDMGRGQQVILDQIPVNTWDVMIGIFHEHYGYPSGGENPAESGTHEEFRKAYESWMATGKPRIMFYRYKINPADLDIPNSDSIKEIEDFFAEFRTGGKHEGLYREYEDENEFELVVHDHLERLLLEWARRGSSEIDVAETGIAPSKRLVSSTSDTTKISVSSPLLVGMIIDLSNGMARVISEISNDDPTITDRTRKAIDRFIADANKYCRAPKSKDEILPKFKFFLMGYGLGNIQHAVDSFLLELTEGEQRLPKPGPVRDLFYEVAQRKNLPTTPNASELHRHWGVYGESISAQLLDIGVGSPDIESALESSIARFGDELNQPHYNHPLMLLVSGGMLPEDSNPNRIVEIAEVLKSRGVLVAVAFLGRKSIMSPRKLYVSADQRWPIEAKRLFDISSTIDHESVLSRSVKKMAIRKSWEVNTGSRLFVQINQEEMLNELIEILTSPLQHGE